MIRLKNEKDLEKLRISGEILSSVLKVLIKEARVGVPLKSLDFHARVLIEEKGAKSAFLGYRPEGAKQPFPATICTSVNSQVVHGVPSDYVLKEGDILKIDIGVNYQGYFTDAAVTIGIGQISQKAEELIKTTKEALDKAIELCFPNNHLGDLGWIIEETVTKKGFSIIKNLTGHGTGFSLHEEPTVYNYGKKGTGLKIEPGLVLAIEPITSLGSGEIKQWPDDSYVTKDGSLSAHFEKTIFVKETGPEILTNF